jgi:hypothetical protein
MYINNPRPQNDRCMSATVIARRNAKVAAFRALFETRLGEDIVNTIGKMAGELTARIQPGALDEDHSLTLSHPVPTWSDRWQTRFHVQVLWRNVLGQSTNLVSTYIPDESFRAQVVYNTGHGYVICVSSVNAHVMVDSRTLALTNATNFCDGLMRIGEFRRTILSDGFEVCVVRLRG